ncbi:MAG: alpha/beta hydrolase [Alphaproteobacteria bacterium]|nr:alpha/beta hydrolase [Alphaproteobacteria bacterium]
MKRVVLYLHGRGASADEADYYKPFFAGCDVIGLDYHGTTPWETHDEILSAYQWLAKHYDSVSLVANSIGAYFGMNALSGKDIEHAYFISPVVDMERLILDIMSWCGVTEQELADKKVIQSPNWDEPLSWEYLEYTRKHPIVWNNVPTDVLYGENDVLIPFETVSEFVKKSGANLTIMKNGEHWFHTEPQVKFHDAWLKNCLKDK